ncbi:putative ribosomal N-acetyltransferase YdaF [Clostridium puniceum]|uniref:Putative ribosomal N-acetyltransferase YdaF n=1 Tax=Clostridium puniceum TaxID=29367 RepID=A0A1S8T8Q0_9CLOT|nr:GNAT family N-acetyltransferase [Clostridium puniceum]OOM74032.1 putative ribosomal N-acetyltransferase YdaF [Clostridium puniceum]
MLSHKGTIDLETNNFILRPFTSKDIPDMYHNWASDKEVAKYLTWVEHCNIEKTNMIVTFWEKSYKSKEYYNWAIEDKYSKHVIGSINLMNLDNYNENCEIGYCIGQDFWNQGIMTEVLNQIIEFSFVEVGFERITARRHINNIASGMLLKKCKFAYEGTLRNVVKDNKGAFVDCKYYSILKVEYFKEKKKTELIERVEI